MANDETHGPRGRYVRRPVDGHGIVRAVWVRDAGALAGSRIHVVARTFPSVVLHVDEGAVEIRAAGTCSPGALTRRAVGFDLHPWVGPEEVDLLERSIAAVALDRPVSASVRSVLARCDVPRRCDVVCELAAALHSSPHRSTMEAVVDRASTSARTVRRRFRATVGMSADRYRVIARAALARERLVTTSTSLAVLAHELGYADQSHLHRDVLELSGSTPTAWRRRRRSWQVASS